MKCGDDFLARIVFLSCLFLLKAFSACAQEVKDDTDPTRAVFISLRDEYYNLGDNVSKNRVLFRSDKTVLQRTGHLKPKGIIFRMDLPLVTARSGSVTQTGLGDLYLQTLLFPRSGEKFTFAAGSGLVLPTATGTLLGGGKWQAAPLASPVWFLPQNRGLFYVKFQDFFSFGGSRNRPDIHHLLTTPTLVWRYTRKSWVLLETEAKIDWKTNNTASYRSGVQMGTILKHSIAVWIEPVIPWGAHREGRWTLKFSFVLVK